MTEHLNAEIVQLTISDISLAIEWLKYSYLYVRIKKVIYDDQHLEERINMEPIFSCPCSTSIPRFPAQNPENYGVQKKIPHERLDKHMQGTISLTYSY